MNRYLKEFLHRGMLFGGFGPIIAGIVFFTLGKAIDGFSISGDNILLAIVTTYLLAFVQAGSSIFNQIEDWPVAKSLLCHLGSIYAAYLLTYLVNRWIPFMWQVVVIFTAIFVVTYFAIWITVFLIVRSTGKRLNGMIDR